QHIEKYARLKRSPIFTYHDQKGKGYAPAEKDPIAFMVYLNLII
ncbi:hypothetical protein AAUPMC_05677, partial [Pasteurella multocida subsp. multocida str. Anand1_cattle]